MPNQYEIVYRGQMRFGWRLRATDGTILAIEHQDAGELKTIEEAKEAIRRVKKAGGSYTKIIYVDDKK